MTNGRLVCIGAACVDRKYRLFEDLHFQTSNPARAVETPGGVACNVARNAGHLGVDVALLAPVGDDLQAKHLLAELQACGVDASLLQTVPGARTSEYAAIIDTRGELVAGVCDAAVVEAFDETDLSRCWQFFAAAQWVFADCNLSAGVLAELVRRSRDAAFKLAIDGVGEAKVQRLPHDLHGVDLLVLNESEAAAYLNLLQRAPDALYDAAQLRARGAASVLLTLGDCGLVVADADAEVSMVPAVPAECVDVTGAGDALIAGTLYALLQGRTVAHAARTGTSLAAMTIESSATVRPDLCAQLLQERMARDAAH